MTPDVPAGLLIRAEASDEQAEVRNVHALAFGAGERVQFLVDALRAAKAALPPLSFVVTVGDRVVGRVMLSACRLDALSITCPVGRRLLVVTAARAPGASRPLHRHRADRVRCVGLRDPRLTEADQAS